MSGHSKFHNIKATKGKADAKRSSIFTKIGRELSVAVKMGGPDPNTNNKLADVILKARANNMPNENIQRSIKKASGSTDNDHYEEIIYEGYGTGGVAFVVECLSDNRNRTAGDVRHSFDKFGGSLGTTGSVMYMFERRGVIVIEKTVSTDEDDIMMMALDAGADDFIVEDEGFIVYTSPSLLHNIRTIFESAGFIIPSAEVEFVPNNYVQINDDQKILIEKLIDMLEDSDDVQNVYHNAEI